MSVAPSQRSLIVGLLLATTAIFAISALRFAHLQADTMDLGYQMQMFWKISHGDWYAFSSVFQSPALAGDGAVTMYPIAYGVRFLGGVYFLFALQAAGVGLAAWGLFRAARQKGWTERAATAVALLFCLYPAVLGASQFDYHPDFVALPFLIWAYVFYQADRRRAYYLCLVAAALSKNMALFGILGWGLGLMLYRHRWRDGLVAALGALALLGFELGWLFPHAFPGATTSLNASLYGYLGHGLVGMATGIVTRFPTVIAHLATEPVYAVWILAPVLGCALLGAEATLAWLALLALNALSTLPEQHMVASQYQVLLAGWLFLAVIEALTRWPAWRRRWLEASAVVSAAGTVLVLGLVVVPELLMATPPPAVVTQTLHRIPLRHVLYVQTHVGALAYQHPVFGQDRRATPRGPLIDGLPTLWREAPHVPTTLVVTAPTSLGFGTTAAEALRAGYRITQHQAGVIVLTGTAHFTPPVLSLQQGGWQPQQPGWILPAWTRLTQVGHVVWPSGDLVAPRGPSGWLIRPFSTWLPAGRYLLSAALPQGTHASGQWVCRRWVRTGLPWILNGLEEGSLLGWRLGGVVPGPATLHRSLRVVHPTWFACGVWATGTAPWRLQSVALKEVSPHD